MKVAVLVPRYLVSGWQDEGKACGNVAERGNTNAMEARRKAALENW